MKVESRECEILKTAFKKEGVSHEVVMSGGGVRRVNVTMPLIFSQIVWMYPLNRMQNQCLKNALAYIDCCILLYQNCGLHLPQFSDPTFYACK